MGADGSPHGKPERQQRQAGQVARALGIAFQEAVRLGRQAAHQQIHDQEGDIVDRVQARQRQVELQRVEEARLAVDQADVAQMQVAMAQPHEALAPPALEEGRQDVQQGMAVGRQRPRLAAIENGGAVGQRPVVGVDHPGHGGLAAAIRPPLGARVEGRHMVGQRLHHGEVDATGVRQPVQHLALVEAAHGHQPFDRRPSPPIRGRPASSRVTGTTAS